MPRKEINRIMDKIKDKSVCIVLPTYNGGKYLAKQLDSILEQTWPNCSVYIRDDGSTDDTVEIAQWYCRIKLEHSFNSRFTEILGAQIVFMKLSSGSRI